MDRWMGDGEVEGLDPRLAVWSWNLAGWHWTLAELEPGWLELGWL